MAAVFEPLGTLIVIKRGAKIEKYIHFRYRF